MEKYKDARIFDILDRYIQKFPKPDALSSKINGEWKKISTQEYYDQVQFMSYGFLKLGIGKGDCIATVSNNRYEWNFVDMGMLQIGAVHVSMYPTISSADYKYILNDCQAKYIIVSDEEILKKVVAIKNEVNSLVEIYTFNEIAGYKHWSEIAVLGKNNLEPEKVAAAKKATKATDLATLIYTSGTTGVPKGVMLSHMNLISNCMASEPCVPVDNTATALSFLPLCHVYERMLGYLYQYLGISIYYAESMEKIGDNLKEVKPNLFSTVPRLLEKVYDKIMAKGHEQTGIKRALFFWAVDLGLKYEHAKKNGWWYEFQLSIANKIIFNKWREALGGNVELIVSGSAPLQPRLARVFWAAQIAVLEGYGLSETSPVVSVNTKLPNGAQFGSVGKVIEDVTVKIAEDGEILVKGPNVMMGYYKKPEATAEVMIDGWFHTGDIGEIDGEGFLKITDRKKEIFKTSGGKYVAPQPIENKMKESIYIEQFCVVGAGQKFPGGLVVPNFIFIKDWLQKQGINVNSNEEIIKNQKVIDLLNAEVNNYNENFGHVEQIKKIVLLPTEFSILGGELTPTLKFKRKIISEKYQKEIDSMYV
jgi:long-chain acyl-CoA synthetase